MVHHGLCSEGITLIIRTEKKNRIFMECREVMIIHFVVGDKTTDSACVDYTSGV